MVTLEEVRRLALALPEAVEADHHGRPSFRIDKRIFATVPDEEHVNVMLDPDDVLLATQHPSGGCTAVYFGARLTAAQLDLRKVDAQLVDEMLGDAWERRAPERLLTTR